MIAPPTIATLSCAPDSLRIGFADGTHRDFLSLWLADNDPARRDPHSSQRLTDVADLPAAPQLQGARLEGGQVVLIWGDGQPPSRFDPDWLADQGRRAESSAWRSRTLWPAGAARDAHRDCPWLPFAELAEGLPAARNWLARLESEGIAFVAGVPAKDGAILEAAGHIGLVQETNYGRLFDVRATPRAENLAYTDLELGLHTDNPYREPVPGFQVLHCLVPAADGGDSLFADGFAIAAALREEDPAGFTRLTRTPVRFAYRSRGAVLEATRPLIQLGAGDEVVAVHYNNRSIVPLPPASPGLADFYAAYRRFALALREPRFQMRVRLAAGELVVFDNWRVLHARTAFRAARHLQGCYLTRDSVFSRCAVAREAASGADNR